MVTCGYCGEEETSVGTNYVRLDSIHDMWCERCGPKKEWLDKEVAAGRKLKIKCTECRKKWWQQEEKRWKKENVVSVEKPRGGRRWRTQQRKMRSKEGG